MPAQRMQHGPRKKEKSCAVFMLIKAQSEELRAVTGPDTGFSVVKVLGFRVVWLDLSPVEKRVQRVSGSEQVSCGFCGVRFAIFFCMRLPWGKCRSS